MYDQFYGFTGRPFQLAPDPHYYFESGTHRKAMSYLGYGLAQGEGMIVITGETGMGKTTLVGHLLGTIDAARLNAVKLVVPQDGADDFLILAAEQFGLDYQAEEQADLLRGIEIQLRSAARTGRRTLLIVDDAQNLSIAAMEQLLLLSGLQLGAQPLIQIFLLGHPEFRHTLYHSPSLDALRQRVIATHHLDPMEPEEIEPYIFHRLGKVGWKGNPSISADAFEQLFNHSEGVPRRLNSLFSRVLLQGALEELTRISGQNIRQVVAELAGDQNVASADTNTNTNTNGPMGAMGPAESEFMGHHKVNMPESPAMVATAEYLALQHRVAKLEAKVAEQDNALRRVIDLLIQWVDQQEDEENSAKLMKDAQSLNMV